MSDSKGASFCLYYFRDLANPGTVDLRKIEIGDSIPFDIQNNCPCCERGLKTFCTLLGKNGRKRMRLGLCESCGYAGYIDRPTKDWIIKFYDEEWDNAKARDIKREAERLKPGLTIQQQEVVRLADSSGISKNRPVSDIGCGNGGILKGFADKGFTNLIGVENSAYRAELGRVKYGYKIITGNFENNDVLTELKKSAPIGIFTSFHVMEHVYYPSEIISIAASLQDEGDHIVLAMPNGIGEAAVTTLFWMPHLHSYTNVGLERLLNRFGYEIVDDNLSYPRHLIVMAKKVKDSKPRYQPDRDYLSFYIQKIRESFFVDLLESGKRRRFSWTAKTYHTASVPAFANPMLDHVQYRAERFYDYFAARLFGRFSNRRSFIISALESRITNPGESPIEIQYDGNIELLMR